MLRAVHGWLIAIAGLLSLAALAWVAAEPLSPALVRDTAALGREIAGAAPHSPTSAPTSLDFANAIFVLMLASFIGLGVIRRVSRLLHTPLMSLTNAISAIAVVGAILVAGNPHHAAHIRILGAVALFASMTNIVSGFLITQRMLQMFRQRDRGAP
jgi:NAD(P) transhydrogenase subunit alpha